MQKSGILTIVAAMTAASICCARQSQATASFDPAHTKIALLPVIDVSGLRKDQSQRQCGQLCTALYRVFQLHGFRFVPGTDVAAAIKKLDIDLNDEEQRKRATMFSVAKEVNADLVAFVLITDQQATRSDFDMFTRAQPGTMKVWLLDVKQEKPILSAKAQEGLGFGALDVALRDFMKPYPKVPDGQRDTTQGVVDVHG